MKNLGNLMKQAQQMQQKMADLQQEMEDLEVAGEAGGGMVKVTLNGKGKMLGMKIDPSLIDPEDPEMLEDLIVAAHADAKQKVESASQAKMAELTGGMQMPPGFQMPF